MRKKMIILLQVIIAIVLVSTSVYAAVDATLALTVKDNKTVVKRGDEITVTLSLKDTKADQKISNISGYVNYNKNVIEEITVDSIIKNDDNTVTIGTQKLPVEDLTNTTVNETQKTNAYVGFNANPTSGNDTMIVIDFSSDISTDLDILSMKFKVKDTATLGEIEKAIEYKMFVIAAGSELSEEITNSVKLTINEKQANNQNDNSDNSNDNNNDNKDDSKDDNKDDNKDGSGTGQTQDKDKNKNTTNNTANKTTNNTTNNSAIDNSVAGTNLPATGAKAIIIPAIILILCAYISYNQYVKYKKI